MESKANSNVGDCATNSPPAKTETSALVLMGGRVVLGVFTCTGGVLSGDSWCVWSTETKTIAIPSTASAAMPLETREGFFLIMWILLRIRPGGDVDAIASVSNT